MQVASSNSVSAQPAARASLRRLPMPDGQPLCVHDWPLPRARGGVLIVHGLGEHAGRYDRLARWFNARGCAVRAYDQRGHGQSPGPRGVLGHPDDLPADLSVVYADYARTLGTAPLLLGHSMGGLVALRAVLDERITPKALVLSSPALRSHASRGLQRLAATLAHLLPNLPLRNGLDLERLSHDPHVAAAYRADPLCHDRVSPRLADFIFRAGAACIAEATRLDVPTLLLVAGDDALVDAAGSRDFSAAAARTKQLTTRYFAALYHELFNEAEPGRSQVLQQLVSGNHKVAAIVNHNLAAADDAKIHGCFYPRCRRSTPLPGEPASLAVAGSLLSGTCLHKVQDTPGRHPPHAGSR